MDTAEIKFFHANLFDGIDDEGKPILNRPPTTSWREDSMLDYLQNAPLVSSSSGFGVNAFTGEEDVPNGFHTDGLWIWPSALPFYLRRHKVEPEPALYERIRDNDYELPEVSEEALRQAADSVLHPPEPQIHLANWEQKFLLGLENIMRLSGVPRANYQILEMTGEGYYLLLRPDRTWEFSMIGDMSRGPKHVMATGGDLREIGWKHLRSVMKPEDVPLTSLWFDRDHKWPYQPIADSPPLSLLAGRHFVELPIGTMVDRYGTPAGNFTYSIGAPFEYRGMPEEFTRDTEYHIYKLRSPLVALTGSVLRWRRPPEGGPFSQKPGGAVAYIFEFSMESLIASGNLTEIESKGSTP